MRADIPLGLQFAQLLHAAGESSPGNLPAGTYAIALAAQSEDQLEAISQRLTSAGIEHVRVVENGSNYQDQLMAIGVRPGPRSALRRHFSSLPLIKGVLK